MNSNCWYFYMYLKTFLIEMLDHMIFSIFVIWFMIPEILYPSPDILLNFKGQNCNV